MYNMQKMLEIAALPNEEKKVTVSEYKGKSLTLLTDKGISVGDTIKISTPDNEFIAILIPRYESADENHIVVKLKSGYNIGIELSKIQFITKVEQWSYQNVSTNDSLLQIRRGGAEQDGWKKES